MEFPRGGKIRLYEDLYKRYSRLGLSQPQDRPIAISGLEKRMIEKFEVHGGFGVLDDDHPGLLQRSLLWCKGYDVASLERINFDAGGNQQTWHAVPPPPSWSWMAYKGGIDYLNLPFHEVEWEEHDILSPWSSATPGTWYHSDSGRDAMGLSVIVRPFKPGFMDNKDSFIMFDITTNPDEPRPETKCVILGRMKRPEAPVQDRIHYVLLVSPVTDEKGRGRRLYKRDGVGHVPGHMILTDQPTELVRVF